MRLLLAALAAAAAPGAPPSDRACLLAWNAPANAAARAHLLTLRPAARALLLPGVVYTDTWSRGKPATRSAGVEACLLTVRRRQRVQIVQGRWRDGGVRRWTFLHPAPAAGSPLGHNVRVLPDGRVTKAYRR